MSKKDEGLSNFEKKVLDCHKNLKEDIIKNSSKEYALVLFKHLLQVAWEQKEDVKIVSGKLEKDFYNKLVEDVTPLLDSAKIQVSVIVLEKVNLEGNNFANAVRGKGDFRMNETEEKFKIPHFILVGSKRFRIETDHDTARADASFNDDVLGEALLSYYNMADRAIPALALA